MLIYLQMIESPEDSVKFEQIYIKYRQPMYTAAYAILKQNEDAEDAVHQAFIRIANHMDIVRNLDVSDGRMASYLITTAQNLSLDMIRARQRFSKDKSAEDIYDEYSEKPSFAPGPVSELAEAMDALPVHQKNILLLRYDNGFTTQEIAAIMGKSYHAVKKSLWRAKVALAKELGREEAAV